MKYIPLFVVIQLVAGVLALLGLPVCLVLSLITKPSWSGPTHFPGRGWFWLWDNDEDGVCPPWYLMVHNKRPIWLNIFIWTALRNSVNNLRYVKGVSLPGRPLWYKTWLIAGRQYYVKAGWEARTGWPSLSAGGGRGF